MTANPWRGEVEITLDGKNYVLRPTFEALSRIERELDAGLIDIARRMASGALTLNALAVIISCCSEAAGEAIAPETLKSALPRSGLNPALAAVSHMIAYAFEGFNGEEN